MEVRKGSKKREPETRVRSVEREVETISKKENKTEKEGEGSRKVEFRK